MKAKGKTPKVPTVPEEREPMADIPERRGVLTAPVTRPVRSKWAQDLFKGPFIAFLYSDSAG
jgi:hypothetical protein